MGRGPGARAGLELEPGAAKALVTHVGDRQQRLLRELEKLALGAAGEEPAAAACGCRPTTSSALTASSAQRGAWTVADAIIAGDAAGGGQDVPGAAPAGRAGRRACSTRSRCGSGRRRRWRPRSSGASRRRQLKRDAADALARGGPADRGRAADRRRAAARADRRDRRPGARVARRRPGRRSARTRCSAISLIAARGASGGRAAGAQNGPRTLRPDVLDALVRDVGVDHQVDGAEHDAGSPAARARAGSSATSCAAPG